jgi:hypothetical protein
MFSMGSSLGVSEFGGEKLRARPPARKENDGGVTDL